MPTEAALKVFAEKVGRYDPSFKSETANYKE